MKNVMERERFMSNWSEDERIWRDYCEYEWGQQVLTYAQYYHLVNEEGS